MPHTDPIFAVAWLIPLFPLLGFLFNAFFGYKLPESRFRRPGDRSPCSRRLPSPASCSCSSPATTDKQWTVYLAPWLIGPGRPAGHFGVPCQLRAAGRPAVRADDADHHRHRRADPPVLDRLHGGGQELPALLHLPEPVHLLHAAARDGQQPAAAVRRLGRRRPLLLSADRLLLREASRRAMRPRKRSSSTASAMSAC